MRDKIFKFTVALRNYEDMYYREMCVQSKLPIKEFCYIILASFEALANDRLFVDEAKQPRRIEITFLISIIFLS